MATLALASLLPLASALHCNPAGYKKANVYDADDLATKIKNQGGICGGTSPSNCFVPAHKAI